MANIFAITTTTEEIKADANGKVVVVFTVTNTSSRPVRGMAKARALGTTRQEWLDIDGETERDFSAGGTQQFNVNFAKPQTPLAPNSPPQAAEKFPFRLDVASSANPDEQFTEGPRVNVEVAATGTPVKPVTKKRFPRWILFMIGAVVMMAIGDMLGWVLIALIAVLVFLVSIVMIIIYFARK
jgi:hypothetical protein